MLKEIMQFRPLVSLIPFTGIQFLDLRMQHQQIEGAKIRRTFWPVISATERDAAGRPTFDLRLVTKDEADDFVYTPEDGGQQEFAPDDEVYSYTSAKAIELLEGVWLPAPFLRLRERGGDQIQRFDEGPTNWARVQVVKCGPKHGEETDNPEYRVIWAFDTAIDEHIMGRPYAAPSTKDVEDNVPLGLASAPESNRSFLKNQWVRDWLRQAVAKRESERTGRPVTPDDLHKEERPRLGEYWAAYIVLLETLQAVAPPPRIRFVDTVQIASQNTPVDVDLVLDIGNSRTCGMWIERFDGQRADITNAFRLELRDFSQPENVYDRPFKSWVEFSPANFGPEDLSRNAGRITEGFYWPSPVRVGPEAARLATLSDGTEGVTGMSSPKRYVWDRAARQLPWANNPSSRPNESDDTPPIKGPFLRHFTEAGDRVRRGGPGISATYSRSSIYTFMVMELLLQAAMQINSVFARYRRAESDLPRRLRKVIVTLPSATPVAEQKIMRERIEHALDVVWSVMGWPGAKARKPGRRGMAAEDPARAIFAKPEIQLDWDEASATHLVYLYNEINHKFRSNPIDLFKMVGRGRGTKDAPALRIASMDIGGGTTDLMIIQHEIAGKETITPNQIFREGFRLAGDDILKAVVEEIILPGFWEAFRDAGVSRPGALLEELFGGARANMGQRENALRGLFVNQVLAVAATGLMSRYENTDPRRRSDPEAIGLLSLLGAETELSSAVRGYVEDLVRQRGRGDFSLESVRITIDPVRIAGVITGTISGVVQDLCDVVRAYDCDTLLITGRPARLPAVRDLVLANAPVPVDRIVSFNQYEVGPWYPFRTTDRRISDPKTTVAVGALLCEVCEGGSQGFIMRSSQLKMWSTARFIGKMQSNDQILKDDIILENLDLDNNVGSDKAAVSMEAPFFLGFRQLPLERWKTTHLYYLSYKDEGMVKQFAGDVPFQVHLERKEADVRSTITGDEEEVPNYEGFEIVGVHSRKGADLLDELGVSLRLQTMRTEKASGDGYWLDTGTLSVSLTK